MPDTQLAELLSNTSFSIERMGYSSMEVHRLWRELNAAHEAGEPLGPLVDSARFTEVSFGYDIGAVTEALMAISDASDGGGSEPATQSEVPQVVAEDEPMVHASAPAVQATVEPVVTTAEEPGKDFDREAVLAAERMAVHLQSARFPVTRTGPRYVMDAVDDLLDHLTSEVNQQRPIAHVVGNARLPIETRAQGYECGSVDDLLDGLLSGAGNARSTQQNQTGHLYVPQSVGNAYRRPKPQPYNKQVGITTGGIFVAFMLLIIVLGLVF